MKNIKKVLIVIIVSLLLFPTNVLGFQKSKGSIGHGDECWQDGSCILMCSYTTKESDDEWYGFDIVSDNGKEFRMIWDDSWSVGKYVYWSVDHNNLHFQNKDDLIKSGICPKYVYLDTDMFDEVCFDTDGSTCKSLEDGFTKYTSSSDSSKEYDFMDHLNIYFTSWSPTLPSCDEMSDLDNSKTPEEYKKGFREQLDKDIITNYLHGTDIPPFITNSPKYKDMVNKLSDSYNKKGEECIAEIQNDSSLTDEEKEKKINKIKGIVAGASEAANEAGTPVGEKATSDYGGEEVPSTCEGLIGTHEFKDFLIDAFNLIKVIGPVLALIFGMIDFLKATASGEEDAKKKAVGSVKNRLIAAVLLYLLPAILEFILSLVPGEFEGTCGIH